MPPRKAASSAVTRRARGRSQSTVSTAATSSLNTPANKSAAQSPITISDTESESVPLKTFQSKAKASVPAKRKSRIVDVDSSDIDEFLDEAEELLADGHVDKKREIEPSQAVPTKVTTSKGKAGVIADKGKGKAKLKATTTDEISNRPKRGLPKGRGYMEQEGDELISDSDDEPEYDAFADQDEEDEESSDDEDFSEGEESVKKVSRRAKVAADSSDEDFSPGAHFYEVDSDSELEEIVLKEVLRASREDLSGGGASSSSTVVAETPARREAMRRATAAEARLKKQAELGGGGFLLDVDDFEDIKPPAASSKGANAWKAPKASMALADLKGKKSKKGRKSLGNLEDDPNDSEDTKAAKFIEREKRKLKAKLGRKLTNGERNKIALHYHHPELTDVWGDLEASIPIIKPHRMPPPKGLKLDLLPFQQESLFWMKKQEDGPWKGGMLADEMGMGKTIQTIALLLSEPKAKPNLVIAPVVALMQWKKEIETHTEGLKVHVWHGNNRDKSDLRKVDVVLTSYGTLEAAMRKEHKGFKRKDSIIREKSPLHAIKWFRIVLDEAHNIKDKNTNVAKAVFALESSFKWCLSGTPLQNRVGELYSLVRFLGADPYSCFFCKNCDCKSLHWSFSDRAHCDECGHSPMQHVNFWNNEILTPISKLGTIRGEGKDAWKKLKILLDRMMLRRTKIERADDLGLPPRTLVVRRDYFSPQEKELYLSLFSDAKREFNTYLSAGTILNNYSNIFSLITRMRQMADHPDLVLRSKTATYIEDIEETALCRICNEIGEDLIMASCSHCFDRECVRNHILNTGGDKATCPVCNVQLSIDLEAEAIEQDEEKLQRARQGILGRLDVNNWKSSTKIEALVEELDKLRHEDATVKSLVFSQFVSMLDIVAFRLKRAGFNVCRLEGGMTPAARQATIDRFTSDRSVTVFLISLKAGGVALNLTEASRVFMLDSWWNPAVEYQAFDRIHRLGQKRSVICMKFCVEDSIESKIIELQEKKVAMTESTLSSDADGMGKLTQEDLAFLFRM